MAKMKSGDIGTDRAADKLRDIEVTLDFTPNADASVLYRQGETMVLACATVAPSLPRWFPRDANRGWVHAEYSLLPGSTDSRFQRERRGAKGRTQEIERLVARSLRGAIDLEALGPIAITVDCDVLQADGGTRCASITGGWIALRLAVNAMIKAGDLKEDPLTDHVAAVSCGIYGGQPVLDLDYAEDSEAGTDANFVMTGAGGLIELQGSAEGATFSRSEFDHSMDLAEKGVAELVDAQKAAVS